MPYHAIIIGAGHNGLVAAALLAKAGLKPLVLERADRIGGCAMTSEVAPGFTGPTLSHRAAIDPAIVRALDLERHGLSVLAPEAHVSALARDGRALTLWADTTRAGQEVASFSKKDAERYAAFVEVIARLSDVLRSLMARRPLPIDGASWGDLFEVVKTSRKLRALGRTDAYRLLRWMPMAVADFAQEWFESEPLCAIVAANGLVGSFLGPRSPGSAAVFLMFAARERHPIATGWAVRGGTGALAEALASAARQAGAEIRTQAEVQRIDITNGAATGVVLTSGEVIKAGHVMSSIDPRRTLLGLIEPAHLSAEILRRASHVRMRGTLAKVNLAVSSLPKFTAFRALDRAQELAVLSSCLRLSPDMVAIERAFDAVKYGGYSDDPWIELTVASAADESLAPPGQHVVSAYVQFVPYTPRGTTWDAERDRLGDVVTGAIAKQAPGFAASVVAREVITPLDLERRFGLTGGQIHQGEHSLEQLLFGRPFLGVAGGDLSIRNLSLCGSGAFPGTGLDGRSGSLAARAVIKSAARSSRT